MVQEELELLQNPPVEEVVLNVHDMSLAGGINDQSPSLKGRAREAAGRFVADPPEKAHYLVVKYVSDLLEGGTPSWSELSEVIFPPVNRKRGSGGPWHRKGRPCPQFVNRRNNRNYRRYQAFKRTQEAYEKKKKRDSRADIRG